MERQNYTRYRVYGFATCLIATVVRGSTSEISAPGEINPTAPLTRGQIPLIKPVDVTRRMESSFEPSTGHHNAQAGTNPARNQSRAIRVIHMPRLELLINNVKSFFLSNWIVCCGDVSSHSNASRGSTHYTCRMARGAVVEKPSLRPPDFYLCHQST